MQERPAAAAGERPLTVLPHTLRMAPMPTPKQMVPFYDPEQFEEFVKEWVPALDSQYVLVERHGGAGDHGIDVAGYMSPARLEGAWHNYQCKRYAAALTWATAATEMRKMFVAAAAKHFTVPTRYVFAAPNISRSLPRQLASPTQSRARFVAELATTTDKFFTALTGEEREAVTELAKATDFSIFECIDLDEMLDLHRTTPHWADRFPHAQLPQGPQKMIPPQQHQEAETRYVQHLLDVYRERYPDTITTLEHVADVPKAQLHLNRQREAFYTAEAIRVFARDSTTPAYFEKLKDDVYDIVVEVAEKTYPNGWERHGAVMEAAGTVQVTQTVLSPYVEPKTRKGICHHLASEDRLIWCEKGEE